MNHDQALWFPYAQMQTMPPALEVSSANGVYLNLKNGQSLIDAISSWWCVIHGYNNPKINNAITSQLNKMAHIMLGGLTHQPAEELAKKLVKITPDGLNHVFFSDSGSVGCEVAMKMAIQFWKNKNITSKTKFLALKRGYHGDTLGVMSLGTDDETMHHTFKNILPEQWFTTPNDLENLETILKNNHLQIAGFFIEPIMQGAGGFYLNTPDYLKNAKKLCEKYNVLFIADEVATGFGRTGSLFAVNQASICPDIMILGKALTGGYLGLSATLATTDIFNTFLHDDSSKAFMHGPTFMGNPLACVAALTSIQEFFDNKYLEKIQTIENNLKNQLSHIKNENIKEIRIKGAMACIEVYDVKTIQSAQKIAVENGVWLRPFGHYLYTMPPYIVTNKELKKITDIMILCTQ